MPKYDFSSLLSPEKTLKKSIVKKKPIEVKKSEPEPEPEPIPEPKTELESNEIEDLKKRVKELEENLPQEEISPHKMDNYIDLVKQPGNGVSEELVKEGKIDKPQYRLMKETEVDQMIIDINQERIEVSEDIKNFFQTNTSASGQYQGKGKGGGRTDGTIRQIVKLMVKMNHFYVLKGD